MVFLGLEVLIGSYIGSKILNKYQHIKNKDTKSLITLEPTKKIGTDADNKNKLIKSEDSLSIQQTAHYFKASLLSLGLVSISYFYPPLLILSLGVFSYASLPIYKKAEKSLLKEKRISNDLLNAIVNIICLATGQYFVAALVSFIYHLGGKTLAQAQGQSKQILANVFEQQPRSVWILKDDIELSSPLEAVKINDIIVINTSEVVAIDGIIIKGQAMLDQHLLTGESQPVEKHQGDRVFASTMLIAGKIFVKVEQTGEETTVAKIAKMLQDTTDFKSKTQLKGETWADKAAIPLLGLSLITLPVIGVYGAASILNSSPGNRVRILAPLETLSHIDFASHQGILIKDGRALEVLMDVDTILFDKTGTLTTGQPEVGNIIICDNYSSEEILTYAGAAEANMNHPIALAILSKLKEYNLPLADIETSEYQLGYGITVKLQGKIVNVGSERFMTKLGLSLPKKIVSTMELAHKQGDSFIIVAIDNNVVGAIEIQPTIRPEVKGIIEGLRKRGIQYMAIVSGDHKATTQALAQELNMDDCFYDVLPENKADIVAKLQKQGRKVCFIGDGVNDSIAMKKADVSLSLSGASTIATDTAQVVLMDGSLSHLCFLFDISNSLNTYLRQILKITFLPVALILGGSLILNFGVLASVVLNNAGLAAGIAYIKLPKKIEKQIKTPT